MAVGFKIDNETLAITVIVGAGLLYYFTRDQKTDAEVKHKRDEDRKAIAIRNLDVLERRYDALHLEHTSEETALPEWIEDQLKIILEDAVRLQSESNDIAGIGEVFFQHTAELIRSGRHYLGRHAAVVADIEAHEAHKKGICATKNVAAVSNVSVTHNHFSTQHQTSILAVQDARKILNQDNRQVVCFQQQHNELKQLHLRNPHSSSRGPDVRPQGGETPQELLCHHTNEGTHSHSVLDQKQQNKDNVVVVRALSACGSAAVAKPTAAQVLENRRSVSDLSTQLSAHTKAISERINRSVKPSSIHEVDIFNQSPSVPSDNHDGPPGAVLVAPVLEAMPPLPTINDQEADMFDQSGKSTEGKGKKKKRADVSEVGSPAKRRKKIPPSPQSVRTRVARVELRELATKLDRYMTARLGGKQQAKAMIRKLDTLMKAQGTPSEIELYFSTTRPGYIKRIPVPRPAGRK